MYIPETLDLIKRDRITVKDIPLRVTYYARVSTKRDEQVSSIEHQIANFEEMIHNNPNWTFVEGYVDRIRGENAAKRDNFMQMISDAKMGKFDYILTKEISRFARDTIDSLSYTRELYRNGVCVYFTEDNIDTLDSDTEFRLTIMSGIAQEEVRKLSSRVKFGHKKSIEKGTVFGNSMIYGYEKDNGKLTVNEKEAKMVRLVFDLYANQNYSIHKIEGELERLGYKNSRGNPINNATISHIIKNPKYKGYYCGNKVKIVDYRTKQQQFLPEEDWILYKDDSGEVVPAIIDEDLWNKANEIYKGKSEIVKNRRSSFKPNNIYTGKIFCYHDNSTYYKKTSSGRRPYWTCSTKIKKATLCISKGIPEDELNEMVFQLFEGLLTETNGIEEYINLYKSIISSTDKSKKNIKQYSNEILKLQKKKDTLLELVMDDTISKVEFKKRNEELNNNIADLEEKTKEISYNSSSINSRIKQLEKIKSIDYSMMKNDPTIIKNIVSEFIDKIYVNYESDTNAEIYVILNSGQKYEYNFNKSSCVVLTTCSRK